MTVELQRFQQAMPLPSQDTALLHREIAELEKRMIDDTAMPVAGDSRSAQLIKSRLAHRRQLLAKLTER